VIGCGDGALDAGEECDDGNRVDADGCSARCRTECRSADDCRDGDACTIDACTNGVCTHEDVRGIDPTICPPDGPVEPLCGGEPIPARLRLPARLDRVAELLARAAQASQPRRASRLLRRGTKILRKLDRQTVRLRDRGRITRQCAAAIAAVTQARRDEIAAVRPPRRKR
jgi:cysteine-rich repeat protein